MADIDKTTSASGGGEAQKSETESEVLASNHTWKVALASIVIVPMCMRCWWGHYSQTPFPFVTFVFFFGGIAVHVAALAGAAAAANKPTVQPLAPVSKVLVCIAGAIELFTLVCVLVHYLRFPAGGAAYR